MDKKKICTGGKVSGLSRVFLGVLLASCLAVSVSPAQKVTFTLEDAVIQTLRNNPEVESSRLEVERADALVREAWGNALPSLNLDARYTRAIKKPVFFLPGDFFGSPGSIRPVEIGSTNALVAAFSASQILFDATVFVGVGAANIYSSGARERDRGTRLEYMTRAKKAFYDVLVAREIFDVTLETQKNSEENFRTVKLLAEQGLVSEYDLLRSEVTVENIRPEVINAENAYRLALNNLKNIMAVPVETEIEISGSLDYIPVDDSTLVSASETMLVRNPVLASLEYQTEFTFGVVSAQKSEYLPVLSAFGNYQYDAQSNDFGTLTDDVIASSQVGLSLRLNIFNGLQTTARVQQAQIEHKKSLEQLSGTRQNLLTATEAVLLRLNKARKRIEAQGRTVEQAERGYEIATTRYSSGLGTQLEVNDAQLALVRANVNKIEAVYEYAVASAELDQLIGRMPAYVQEEDQ